MSNCAQHVSPVSPFFTQINQDAFKWLCINYGDGAAALWVWMRTFAPKYNHYAPNLARDKGVSERTILRRLNELRKAGALVKVTRKLPNGHTCSYYRPVEIPTGYRRDVSTAAELAKTPVDNSKPRRKTPMTNLSDLTEIKKPLNTNKTNIPRPAVHSTDSPPVDNPNSKDGGAGEGDKKLFFDLIADAYPAHKVPFDNPVYMQSCFNQFKICTDGMNFTQLELFSGYLIQDIKRRVLDSPHWKIGNIPQFFGYFKERRWMMPLGADVDFQDGFENSPRIPQAAERLRILEATTGRKGRQGDPTPYVTVETLSEAVTERLAPPDRIQNTPIGHNSRDWATRK